MANLALGFGELLAGGVLLTAAITGASLPDVVTGKSGGPKGLGGSDAGGGESAPPSGAGANTSATGTVMFDGKPVAAWIAPALRAARASGKWTGKLSSGWRSLAEQTRIWNSGQRPAAQPGTSNHEQSTFPGGAADVTDAPGLNAALKGTQWENVLVWAGSKDPVHFSHPHGGSY